MKQACPECGGSLKDSYKTEFGRLCRDCYERRVAQETREEVYGRSRTKNGKPRKLLSKEKHSLESGQTLAGRKRGNK